MGWTAGAVEPECGTYSFSTVNPAYSSFISFSGGTLKVMVPYGGPVGVIIVDIEYKRDIDGA